ncbi:BON domain-containing protein [Paraburkholderia sp. LEh10]|uniref:BON domain-containing protein n=1 Tax=Paraburkholderia sp. LEh10 TaxID=2821353 RepID=UPI001FD871B8|nr:BON domain-containing protein [Paraburkholderia sp. LEh10]
MSSIKNSIIVVVVTAVMAGVAPAYAQTDTAAASAATAPPTKKAIRKQNHQLEIKVRHALTATKHLDSSGVMILARGGEVTLLGEVPDASQIQTAGSAASKVAGVTGVTNDLHVSEPGN